MYLKTTIENDEVLRTWIDPSTIPPIELDGEYYSAEEVIHALNYGSQSYLFSKLASVWRQREDVRELSHYWDRSLLKDFATKLFDNRKDAYKAVHGVNLGLQGPFEDYMASQNSQLLFGVLESFPGILGTGDFRPPISFVIFDLVNTISYLKDWIAEEMSYQESVPSPQDCGSMLAEIWRGTNNPRLPGKANLKFILDYNSRWDLERWPLKYFTYRASWIRFLETVNIIQF